MPRHNYYCRDCAKPHMLKHGLDDPYDLPEEVQLLFVYETQYGINASEVDIVEATRCPLCAGSDVQRMISAPAHVRIRGGDWREFYNNNKAAMKRDMDVHTLDNNDPYASSRPDGDKEEIRQKLIDSGKRDPKRLYFT